MKYKDFIKILKSLGYFPLRQNGSHQIWSNGEKNILVVNKGTSKDINRMIVRKTLKDINYPDWFKF